MTWPFNSGFLLCMKVRNYLRMLGEAPRDFRVSEWLTSYQQDSSSGKHKQKPRCTDKPGLGNLKPTGAQVRLNPAHSARGGGGGAGTSKRKRLDVWTWQAFSPPAPAPASAPTYRLTDSAGNCVNIYTPVLQRTTASFFGASLHTCN